MNVYDETTGQVTLLTYAGSKMGAAIAMLIESLGQPHSTHLQDVGSQETPPVPTVTDIKSSGVQQIVHGDDIPRYLYENYDEHYSVSYKPSSGEAEQVKGTIAFLSEIMKESDDETPVARRALSLYLHLEQHLQKSHAQYLVGNKCTLADFVVFPYVNAAGSLGLDLERFPELTTWYNRLSTKPAVRKGMAAVRLELS